MLTMRHLPLAISVCHLCPPHPGFKWVWGSQCRSRAHMPRTAGRIGFSGFGSWNGHEKPQNQGPRKWQHLFLLARPSSFCVFWWRAWISPKSGFWKSAHFRWNHHVNVVPNGRGCKTHLCTLGSEIDHVRSASNMVPKYFFLNWHFLSHSPSRRQGELFHFFSFSHLEHRSLSIFFMVAFCSAITPSVFPFCSVSHFCCYCWVVFVFLLVSLLLIILHRSFLSLDFCLLVLLPVLFRFFAFYVFFFLLFVSSSSCFFSFSCVSFCDSPIFFVGMFLLCVFFSPCSSSFSFFGFLLPHAFEKENHGKNNYLILFAFRGSLRTCPFRKIIVYFVLGWISFVRRTCLC